MVVGERRTRPKASGGLQSHAESRLPGLLLLWLMDFETAESRESCQVVGCFGVSHDRRGQGATVARGATGGK